MTAALRELERIRSEFGGDAAERKLTQLERLAQARLRSAAAVERLHEVLCFLRAYPDDEALLARVEELLAEFERRADLRRFAAALQDSGIAGTATVYPFFAEMASWLARAWPQQLEVAWEHYEQDERLESLLPLLVTYAESPGLDEWTWPMREWCQRLKGPRETDAAFLVRRFDALPVDSFVREWLYQEMKLCLRLGPGPDTPARSREKWPRARVHPQTAPLDRGRPALAEELAVPPVDVRALPRQEGALMIDLARRAMVTRGRDLDVFAYGDPEDVRLIDCGEGLQFAAIGAVPERRLLLEAVYGFLTLKNGVPIGYLLNSALYGSAEVAYNVFETWRGGEAARIYGRALSALHHVFGADTFTIFPYQLGDDNDEALESGAWWFYQKLGFRAKEPGVLRLMRGELRRMQERPRHRTSISRLRQLARHNVYWHQGPARDDVIGVLPLANVGLAVSAALAKRFGSERELAERVCEREVAELLEVRSTADWSEGERLAWRRWAPLLASLPGLARWGPNQRRSLAGIVRAKGGRRESEFVQRFDAHGPLRKALRELALAHPGE